MYIFVKTTKRSKTKVNNFIEFMIHYHLKYEINEESGSWLQKKIESEHLEKSNVLYCKPYYNLFTFDLRKFLHTNGEYFGCGGWKDLSIDDVPALLEGEFPIKNPFKFYSWIHMMQEYYKINDIIQEFHACYTPSNKSDWRTVEERYSLLMEMCEYINLDKSKYRLISQDLPENLDNEIVKNQEYFYFDEFENNFKLKKI